jgi:GPH family glycoside/pentoside/hexuronide:cation symporter
MQSVSTPVRTSPFRYAIGMFGTSIPINMFKAFAAKFYVDGLGLTTTNYALVLFVYAFLDAIDNPVYGFLSDRTRSPWGRRRPWLIIGAPLLAVAFILFYNPPELDNQTQMLVYMLLMYCLTGTLDSLINANYGALFPELFQGDALRAHTNAMRQGFQLVAMVISIALTPLIAGHLGYSLTALIYGILGAGVIIYMAFGCHETPQALEMEKPPLWGSLKVMLTNSKFWIFGFANAFYSAAMALVMQAVSFFVKYTLGLSDSNTTILLGTVLVVAIAAVALWAALVRRFTLMPIWRVALVLLALGFVPLYFANSLGFTIVASCVVGFGMAGAMATMDLIGARIMDEDTRRYNLRREGLYSSAMGFMNRLNGLFVSLAFYLVNVWYGFISGLEPGPNPGGAARFLLVIFPLGAMALSIVFSLLLHFPEDQANRLAASEGTAPQP